MKTIDFYLAEFEKANKEYFIDKEPIELYEPINYILNLGGKRLRPIITLMSCDFFGGDLESAIKPSLSLEYFHNFTLMHDDIMDSAPLRRGKTTVHEKYDVNRAILSGDALLIKSYQFFEDLAAETYKKVVQKFSKTALQLCEGQQYDMNFENDTEITEDLYMKMIEYKTGVLAAYAFWLGASIANANNEDSEHIYNFGKHLGIAFQLKDDLLDVYGDKETVGKIHAGDIHENKKTILYLKAIENANKEQLEELKYWYSIKTENLDKVYSVENIFKKIRVDHIVEDIINKETNLAKSFLEKIDGNKKDKSVLYDFCDSLIGRTY